jgi:hypothetical protein
MRTAVFWVSLVIAGCSDSEKGGASGGGGPDASTATPPPGTTGTTPPGTPPASSGTCTAGEPGAVLKIGDKPATVDLTRKRVMTAGTVVEFGYDDESTRELVKGEHILGIKTFFKNGEANVDWQPSDLDPDHAAISVYHLIDQTEPLSGKPRKMRYGTVNYFKLTDPGFSITRSGDYASVTYKGTLIRETLADDTVVPKEITVDMCFTVKVK